MSSENDFTVTAPSSNSHAFESWNVILASPGTAKKRSLCAPSDQKGALISYGMTPGATWCFATDVNSPVSLSLRGNGGSGAAGGCKSSW